MNQKLKHDCYIPRKNSIILSILLSAVLPMILLTGCTHTAEPVSQVGFYLDTVVQITLYNTDGDSESCIKNIQECFTMIDDYEHLFSVTIEGSDIWNINHSGGRGVVVSDDTASLLQTALYYSDLSGGRVDLTVLPLGRLWNFGSGTSPHVPDDTAIQEALSHIDYHAVKLDGNVVTLTDPYASIDLGFIAKGYIADKLKEYLLSQGVESACISLGGNVITIGERPDGTPFRIGIQKPFAEGGTTLGTIEIRDLSVVTSGIYERCFYENDVLYHHVLDTATGYPVDNELASVTIICESSTKADALSTSCLCMGLEKGRQYLDREGVEYLLITKDGTQYVSENFPVISESP